MIPIHHEVKRVPLDGENEPVTVAELKSWGKIDSSAEDTLINDLIKQVRELHEEWTGRSYRGTTITAHWNEIRGAEIPLPFGPVRAISSVKRVYEDGTLSDSLTETTDYFVKGMDFKTINLYKRWQSAGQIITGLRVEYTAGHGSESGELALPGPLKEALMRHVVTDYDMRDDLEVHTPVLYDWTKEALQPYKIANLWL